MQKKQKTSTISDFISPGIMEVNVNKEHKRKTQAHRVYGLRKEDILFGQQRQFKQISGLRQ